MKLSDVMSKAFTDEEYLAHQRELHRARCEALTARVRLRKDDAEHIARLRAGAAYAMDNMFCLPGTGGERVHVGTPPAWSECRTTDEEYLWVLNRMGWFHTLTELYLLTGERVYAEKVLADMENWVDTCPMLPLPTPETTDEQMLSIRRFYSGLTPWRSLEVGIRVFDTWNEAYDRLLLTDLMTPALHTKLALSFYQHAQVLREMSPRYWPKANHNHYLHEMLGLLVITCMFPDIKEAPTWQPFAIRELGRCAANQFTADGGQVEGSTNYHAGCLNMFFSLAELARTFSLTLPDSILDVCRKAAVYDIMVVGPDGNMVSVGDSALREGGAATARRYYRCFGELGPIAKIFGIHPSNDPLIIPEEVQAAARELAKAAPGEDNYQRELGQYMARTGWTREDSHFFFICCTPVVNGHAHQDPMSFCLSLKGDRVVIDPSFFTYQAGEDRKLFKSPEYHSCLTFDDKPPFEYLGMWSYGPQKEGSIRKTYHPDGVYAADASHHGYDPDYHKRLCALVGDDIFLVADDVINVTGTDVRLYFHMDDPTVRIEGRTAVSERIRVLLPEGVAAASVPSHRSPHNDKKVPSARIVLTDTAHKSRQYLTVFTKRDDVTDAHIERTDRGVRISYRVGGEEKRLLWVFSCSLSWE